MAQRLMLGGICMSFTLFTAAQNRHVQVPYATASALLAPPSLPQLLALYLT